MECVPLIIRSQIKRTCIRCVFDPFVFYPRDRLLDCPHPVGQEESTSYSPLSFARQQTSGKLYLSIAGVQNPPTFIMDNFCFCQSTDVVLSDFVDEISKFSVLRNLFSIPAHHYLKIPVATKHCSWYENNNCAMPVAPLVITWICFGEFLRKERVFKGLVLLGPAFLSLVITHAILLDRQILITTEEFESMSN
ncbi:hypothetical protein T01_14936 [Trichinella spiralis]|uniref:Uncharacterized protein n=1 Tax=Trichinella spiralis TaxID=6334 RepID=A0A0V1C0D5_TRISP|nr:hypothetical protein T01_14936 [Trichinella spiralis]